MKISPSRSELSLRIGQNISRIRHEKKEKLINVAHGIHKSSGVVSKVDHGVYPCLSIALLIDFADYFDADIDEILLRHD